MEVYIDDMLVKSVKAEPHITHLVEAFQVLKSYNMKLNPTKYKIKVVLSMLPPSNIKEIQRLTGRIAALSLFVSKASNKCQPLFQVLKKAFQWDAHYKEAFPALKTYLSSPPVLVSPSE